jgi:hypothetical protein
MHYEMPRLKMICETAVVSSSLASAQGSVPRDELKLVMRATGRLYGRVRAPISEAYVNHS